MVMFWPSETVPEIPVILAAASALLAKLKKAKKMIRKIIVLNLENFTI
jgi:hypothetical protein